MLCGQSFSDLSIRKLRPTSARYYGKNYYLFHYFEVSDKASNFFGKSYVSPRPFIYG